MNKEKMRRSLIDATIRVIAQSGLDKATTKRIGAEAGLNEVYIYRIFEDKEDLFAKVFEELDEELAACAMEGVSVMYERELDYETRCRRFFMKVWTLLLANREKCIAYNRYYYSQYFQSHSAAAQYKRYAPLVRKFEDAFQEGDVRLLLGHILNVMVDFAGKIHDGAVPNDDETAECVFKLVYSSVKPFLKRR